jgi:hypothetical protein
MLVDLPRRQNPAARKLVGMRDQRVESADRQRDVRVQLEDVACFASLVARQGDIERGAEAAVRYAYQGQARANRARIIARSTIDDDHSGVHLLPRLIKRLEAAGQQAGVVVDHNYGQ